MLGMLRWIKAISIQRVVIIKACVGEYGDRVECACVGARTGVKRAKWVDVVLHEPGVDVEKMPGEREEHALEITAHVAVKRRVESAGGVPKEIQQITTV